MVRLPMMIKMLLRTTIPPHLRRMRTNAKLLIEDLGERCRWHGSISKVDTPISRKLQLSDLLKRLENSRDALGLLFIRHRRPFLLQARTGRKARDDVLAAKLIGGIIAPVQDLRDWNACFLLDCDHVNGRFDPRCSARAG